MSLKKFHELGKYFEILNRSKEVYVAVNIKRTTLDTAYFYSPYFGFEVTQLGTEAIHTTYLLEEHVEKLVKNRKLYIAV